MWRSKTVSDKQMKGYREKDTSEQCLECRGKRPRIYGKWLE